MYERECMTLGLGKSAFLVEEAFNERYLGIPTAVGRITRGTFDHIRERARGMIQGCSEKLLACAGQ